MFKRRRPEHAGEGLAFTVRITSIETISVVVPIREGTWHSPEYEPEDYVHGGATISLDWQQFPIVLLRMHTDEGLVGLGEVPKGVSESEVRRPAQYYEGRDLFSFNLQELPYEWFWFEDTSVYLAYEMALFDLMGKALGIPAYRLLGGGKYRDLVPVSRCSGRMTPAHAAETAREAVAQGYTVLKMKAKADDDLADRLEAIQDAVGDDLGVVVDPNQRFSNPATLMKIIEAIRARGITNVQCFESPFDQSNLDWYSLARGKMSTAIALHIEGPHQIREAIRREACDWINTGGSMVNCYKTSALCEAAGIPTWHGSGVDLGIAEAAHTHAAAACKSMTLTSDICSEVLREDDLIVDPLVIENGHVRVPEGPGLGVELDEDALERYRVRE
ncbi:MAG: mandelate racemase/muconate lactonizing enzyme family protein [Thermomicrobiales bacterium]